MFKNQLIAYAFVAAAIAATPSLFSAAADASEPQIVPAVHPRPVKVEPILVGDREIVAQESQTLRPAAKNKGPKSAAADSVQSRQLALIVLLLSTLGVATRLLWRRHLRALSFVEAEDGDEDMRSN